jgi:ABC-type proline/glycine betaine transport system permease subunit
MSDVILAFDALKKQAIEFYRQSLRHCYLACRGSKHSAMCTVPAAVSICRHLKFDNLSLAMVAMQEKELHDGRNH